MVNLNLSKLKGILLMYKRFDDTDLIYVMINLNAEPVSADLSGGKKFTELLKGAHMNSGTIEIPAMTALILKKVVE